MALYDVSTSEKKASPELVAGGTLYSANPVGTILPFGGTSIPSGWCLCDGREVSRTTYSELFAVIGTSFGSGNGTSTFNLPDLREAVPKGAGLTGHTVGAHLDADGLAVGEFLDDQIQNIGKMKAQATSGYSLQAGGVAGYINGKSDLRTGATTEVKSVGVNYIICMKQTAVPADFLSKVDEILDTKYKNIQTSYTGSTVDDVITSLVSDIISITEDNLYGGEISAVWTNRSLFSGSYCVFRPWGIIELLFQNPINGKDRCIVKTIYGNISSITWQSEVGKYKDLGSFSSLSNAGSAIYTDAISNVESGYSELYCINVTGIGYLFGRVYRISTSEAHGIFNVQKNGNNIARIYSFSQWGTATSSQYWGYSTLTTV